MMGQTHTFWTPLSNLGGGRSWHSYPRPHMSFPTSQALLICTSEAVPFTELLFVQKPKGGGALPTVAAGLTGSVSAACRAPIGLTGPVPSVQPEMPRALRLPPPALRPEMPHFLLNPVSLSVAYLPQGPGSSCLASLCRQGAGATGVGHSCAGDRASRDGCSR